MNQNWEIEFQRSPEVEFGDKGDRVRIKDVRDFRYDCAGGREVSWQNREYQISDCKCVDYIVVPFPGRFHLAHVMVSFGFKDGQHLVVSVEARRRVGQHYSILRGLFRAYEIIYVIADERDAIGVRTQCRGELVHLYRSSAKPEEAQKLLLSMLKRANALAGKREYYNTLFNNCATNIRWHVNQIWPRLVPWHIALLFTGRSDLFAYKLGLLRAHETFRQMRQQAAINDLVPADWENGGTFSRTIRQRLVGEA